MIDAHICDGPRAGPRPGCVPSLNDDRRRDARLGRPGEGEVTVKRSCRRPRVVLKPENPALVAIVVDPKHR